MSWRLAALNAWLRRNERPYLAAARDPAEARSRMERQMALLPRPSGLAIRDAPLGGVPALRLGPAPGAPLLLWLHGGAFCLGSPRTHLSLVAGLARRAGMRAALPAYRLAPEHRFPAGHDDCLAAWRALLAEGERPERIALGGDSAGAGLAFALLADLLRAGLPGPAAVVAFSPWVDLTLSGESLRSLAPVDALLPAARLPEIRDLYLAGADPRDPRASPVFGAYPGAPPVLIQASRAEILRDDAIGMAERLGEDGGDVTLDLWPAVPHVWQVFSGWLPEASAALDRAAAFLRRQLASAAR
jgi:monoterpene epsilon-lactone hydrolase